MNRNRITILLFVLAACWSCQSLPDRAQTDSRHAADPNTIDLSTEIRRQDALYGRGALLLSRFTSFEQLQQVIRIEYGREDPNLFTPYLRKPYVRLTHHSGGRQVSSTLVAGVSELDFANARDGDINTRIYLLLNSPYSIAHRHDLKRVYILSRWRSDLFQEGDVAFYDVAEHMMWHISDYDSIRLSARDLGEKGFINTFNHITNQAMITAIFSERLADLIADAHERYRIPKLITGRFTPEEQADIEDGPVDNYVDMINNEWGQELGKRLGSKYGITRKTVWTKELLVDFLNDVQLYHSRAFGIGFDPFMETDRIVIRFTEKLNRVMHESELM